MIPKKCLYISILNYVIINNTQLNRLRSKVIFRDARPDIKKIVNHYNRFIWYRNIDF